MTLRVESEEWRVEIFAHLSRKRYLHSPLFTLNEHSSL